MYNQINKFTSMKKNFEQPELMVVQMSNRDIVTESLLFDDTTLNVSSGDYEAGAAGRRFEDWE